jgi:ADP-ribose pyrophosphatase YjhB (NUDIX family)
VTGANANSGNDGWETVSSQTCFENKNLTVVTEKIRSPARHEPRSWTVVRRKRAIVVAAMTAEGKLILIREERIPIRAAIWEVPAGQIDDESNTDADEIAAVALRELREETGYELAESGELIPLGDYLPRPGSLMSVVISSWLGPFMNALTVIRTTNRNRSSIVAPLARKNCAG